ncbi:MAG: lipopolysaccharide biosynthesis protein [Lachnospiraceae bacterium]|nr:lipopolysaccharide biosynthesis protein [Lachnospiraceae bacterium]
MENKTRQIKKDYIWNTVAGLINAAESVFMSVVVTRITGLTDAGILTIAFAVANLMMTIGKFGVRTYQVTDIEGRFSFSIYLKTRMITALLMLISTLGYLLYASFRLKHSPDKIIIILAICMIYTVETIEDVIWAYYQRNNRLYAGAQMFCIRWLGILLVFPVVLLISKSLAFTLFVCLGISIILFFCLLHYTFPHVCSEEDKVINWKFEKKDLRKIGELLKIAFPLFGSSFLSFYVNNAPKYAIDACLTDEIQACYGFVAMPVFVIRLLNDFVYQPTLVPLAVEWEQKQHEKFLKRIMRQFGVIFVISIVCLLGAYFVGIPVLSLLYHTDLSAYKDELMILLLAGGFLAISGYLSIVLTIMRCQKDLLWPYCLIAIIAVITLKVIVFQYGTIGAALCYMGLMVFLCVLYGGILLKKLKGIVIL